MTKEKEKCLICGEGFINILLHVKTRHGLTEKEYREYDSNKTLENAEMLDSASEVEETLGKFEKSEETVSDLLEQYGISREELTDIIEHYKRGTPLPIVQVTRQKTQTAEGEARKLSSKDTVSTRDLYIAEALVKYYNFKVREVTTKGGTIPKTWVLDKV